MELVWDTFAVVKKGVRQIVHSGESYVLYVLYSSVCMLKVAQGCSDHNGSSLAQSRWILVGGPVLYYHQEKNAMKYIAAHPSPAPEDTYRVCRPCSVFAHANPRASCCVGTSGTGRRTDTAQRASGDATASSTISWTLFP